MGMQEEADKARRNRLDISGWEKPEMNEIKKPDIRGRERTDMDRRKKTDERMGTTKEQNVTGKRKSENVGEVPVRLFVSSHKNQVPSIDMGRIVGVDDILFICLDTLRYDVAVREQEAGATPVLNRYGPWEKRQAPGNFTYPSHHAMFAGFFPCRFDARSLADREMLFFPRQIGMGNKAPKGAFAFSGSTIMEGLEKEGYDTWCVGGVSFFDKRSDLGKVFPGYFQKSYWNPSFSCPVRESTKNQVDFILKKLSSASDNQRIFLYLNVDAIHYPNYFYLEGAVQDSIASHGAALRYVDGQIGRLLDGWKARRGNGFVICCSDHGTCYGEDGCQFHGIDHPAVNTIPYKHFMLTDA